jgi:ABC-type Zn uptake system ZnuABC Zn-binding protein ZnuA
MLLDELANIDKESEEKEKEISKKYVKEQTALYQERAKILEKIPGFWGMNYIVDEFIF